MTLFNETLNGKESKNISVKRNIQPGINACL